MFSALYEGNVDAGDDGSEENGVMKKKARALRQVVDKSRAVSEVGCLSGPFVSNPVYAYFATGMNRPTHLVCALTCVNV